MHVLLPPKIRTKINYKPLSGWNDVQAKSQLSVVLIEKSAAKSLLKQCQRSPALIREYDRLRAQDPWLIRLSSDDRIGNILCIFVKNEASTFEKLTLAAKVWRQVADLHCEEAALATLGLHEPDSWLDTLLAAALAGNAPMPQYKTKPKLASLKTLTLVTAAPPERFAATIACDAGNHLARWLTAQPPNRLDSKQYRLALQALAREQGWQSEFIDVKKLTRLKAGAFLAVTRSNAHVDAGILRLSFRTTARKSLGTVCLVGKGICFDTGGINLKSHKHMFDMHTDMQGSAVAVGTLLALSLLKVPYDIECWLALSENEIGPKAYRPQEVVTACNGTTIQVVHSDAEGRMVLADTLALAARHKPDLMIDFATLTGACITALTDRMSGAFSNHEDLRQSIETAGQQSGERVWSFPMQTDFDADLESGIADILQCTQDSKGDHILAARFLNHFVPASVPWIHVDLSAANRTGGLAHVPTEITGFGVRWAVQFMADYSFAIASS